jgi:hypothetical protein
VHLLDTMTSQVIGTKDFEMTTPRIASWIVAQAIDSSKENFEGLHYPDAVREVNALKEAMEFIALQDGETESVVSMRISLQQMQTTLAEWSAEREATFLKNGLNILADHGFSFEVRGGDVYIVKPIEDVEDAEFRIFHQMSNPEDARADDPRWQVMAVIGRDGEERMTLVREMLPLQILLDSYEDLPLPSDDSSMKRFDTWEEARNVKHLVGLSF